MDPELAWFHGLRHEGEAGNRWLSDRAESAVVSVTENDDGTVKKIGAVIDTVYCSQVGYDLQCRRHGARDFFMFGYTSC